jgi:hypothetical protein
MVSPCIPTVTGIHLWSHLLFQYWQGYNYGLSSNPVISRIHLWSVLHPNISRKTLMTFTCIEVLRGIYLCSLLASQH